MLPFSKRKRRRAMEPIVLLGLICVCYGGYVSLMELWQEVSALFLRRNVADAGVSRRKERCLQPPIKKMAGMHV